MRNFSYVFGSIPALLAILGNSMGEWFTFSTITYAVVFLPLIEWIVPTKKALKPENEEAIFPTILLVLLSILHLAVLVTLIYGIANHRINGIFIVSAAISSGINAGMSGIVVAHELIHRKEKFLRYLGIFNMLQVNYTHFYIEHIKGHHKYVGTEADPATAKYGENLYKFIARTIPGQLISAFEIEKRRLIKKNKNYFSLSNFVVTSILVQIIILVLLFLFFEHHVILAFVIYSITAVFLLEYVNYIEHYGLSRNFDEKFEAHHAWQTNKVTSRFGLLELSQHADHHLKAHKPFHTLKSHEGNFLPSGYFGMFYLALIPPIWFKVVNPIIKRNLV